MSDSEPSFSLMDSDDGSDSDGYLSGSVEQSESVIHSISDMVPQLSESVIAPLRNELESDSIVDTTYDCDLSADRVARLVDEVENIRFLLRSEQLPTQPEIQPYKEREAAWKADKADLLSEVKHLRRENARLIDSNRQFVERLRKDRKSKQKVATITKKFKKRRTRKTSRVSHSDSHNVDTDILLRALEDIVGQIGATGIPFYLSESFSNCLSELSVRCSVSQFDRVCSLLIWALRLNEGHRCLVACDKLVERMEVSEQVGEFHAPSHSVLLFAISADSGGHFPRAFGYLSRFIQGVTANDTILHPQAVDVSALCYLFSSDYLPVVENIAGVFLMWLRAEGSAWLTLCSDPLFRKTLPSQLLKSAKEMASSTLTGALAILAQRQETVYPLLHDAVVKSLEFQVDDFVRLNLSSIVAL